MILRLLLTFIGTFGALWTMIEAYGYFFEDVSENKIKTWNEGKGFWIIIFISLFISIFWNTRKVVIAKIKELIFGRPPLKDINS